MHNDRHSNISEHKTTRINNSHYKLEYKKLLPNFCLSEILSKYETHKL